VLLEAGPKVATILVFLKLNLSPGKKLLIKNQKGALKLPKRSYKHIILFLKQCSSGPLVLQILKHSYCQL
jgi:hypothetical protein